MMSFKFGMIDSCYTLKGLSPESLKYKIDKNVKITQDLDNL